MRLLIAAALTLTGCKSLEGDCFNMNHGFKELVLRVDSVHSDQVNVSLYDVERKTWIQVDGTIPKSGINDENFTKTTCPE